ESIQKPWEGDCQKRPGPRHFSAGRQRLEGPESSPAVSHLTTTVACTASFNEAAGRRAGRTKGVLERGGNDAIVFQAGKGLCGPPGALSAPALDHKPHAGQDLRR